MLSIKDEFDTALEYGIQNQQTISMRLRVAANPWEIIELTSPDSGRHYIGKSTKHDIKIKVNYKTGVTSILTESGDEFTGAIALCYPVPPITIITKRSARPPPAQIKGKRLRRGDVVQKPFYVQESKRDSRKHY